MTTVPKSTSLNNSHSVPLNFSTEIGDFEVFSNMQFKVGEVGSDF